jgi:hypothetical protein
MAGIESEGWAERHAGKKSPQGTAFTTPTRSYGDQCETRTYLFAVHAIVLVSLEAEDVTVADRRARDPAFTTPPGIGAIETLGEFGAPFTTWTYRVAVADLTPFDTVTRKA